MPTAAIAEFLRKYGLPIVIAILAIMLLIFVFSAGGSRERAKQDQATIKTDKAVANASAAAADTRVSDAITSTKQQQELHDATANVSNSDDARRRAGCVILRQQGRDTSGIPACR